MSKRASEERAAGIGNESAVGQVVGRKQVEHHRLTVDVGDQDASTVIARRKPIRVALTSNLGTRPRRPVQGLPLDERGLYPADYAGCHNQRQGAAQERTPE